MQEAAIFSSISKSDELSLGLIFRGGWRGSKPGQRLRLWPSLASIQYRVQFIICITE